MFCQNCGKEMKDGDRFCQNCGCARMESTTNTGNTTSNVTQNEQVVKSASKIGEIQHKIGVLLLIAGIICMIVFITAPGHRSEAFPAGCGLIAGGVALLVVKQKK
ncbi:MAG: zinc-ribbon domain-containing protein [Lachnospiraceae bacterium]|nr:zinc-ribbon domain-containing protein [Lachnospiraceae bacterium]